MIFVDTGFFLALASTNDGADYPEHEEEDIRQALAYAAAIVGDE